MDKNELDVSVPEHKKSEAVLTAENDNDLTETSIKVTDNKNEIIENIIEQVRKRQLLVNKQQNLQHKVAVLISQSSEKEYFLKLNVAEGADDEVFKEFLDSITAKEDESFNAFEKCSTRIESLKEEIIQKRELLVELRASFKNSTERAALSSVNSETGERLSAKEVKEILAREEVVSDTLQEYQLHSIEKRHNLHSAIQKKKNIAEGPLDFAEYEMMCIETQNNKEIIQPISEEIKNIIKRASSIINVLSHLGQKLYLAQKEKNKASNAEKKLDIELNEMRDLLFEEKLKYTRMQDESKELQHKFILLQHPRLIEDYKDVIRKNEEAKKELERLKTIYREEAKILSKKITK